ncbi:MAG: hypothetical protein M1591_00365 [Deltaproteobacteria bacterium]|nr:hypothetical protein [Deltaproteobacteria bacterium]
MKKTGISIFILILLYLTPLNTFAQQSPQQSPKILSNSRLLRIVEGGKFYPMAMFTSQNPLKIEVQGPGKLILYVKTAIFGGYSGLPEFRLFIKKDSTITNQYMFPKTTRSNLAFEGVKNYNPSAETHSIPIDVPDGSHTYEISLSPGPSLIGLASFGYTQLTAKTAPAVPAARSKRVFSMRRPDRYLRQHEKIYTKAFYINPYIMAGGIYEQGINNDSIYGGGGIHADVFIKKHIVISGMIDYVDSAQKYDTLATLSLPSGSGPYILNEQFLLIHALVSYAFLHNRNTIAMIGAGWGDLELINDILQDGVGGDVLSALLNTAAQSAPVKQSVYNINGPVVSALLKLGLSSKISLYIRPSYMQDVWNVSGNTSSVLGTPYSLLLYPVGLAYDLSSGVALAIGYDGRMLTFKDTSRFYNGGFIAAIF